MKHGGSGGLTREWLHHEMIMSGTHLLRTPGLVSYHTNSGCSKQEMQLQTELKLLEVMHALMRPEPITDI